MNRIPLQEKAVIIGTIRQKDLFLNINDQLEELAFLAVTAGAEVIGKFVQKMSVLNGSTFIGKGKLQEIAGFIKRNEADVAIFDDELSPIQFKNLEKILECKVLDR